MTIYKEQSFSGHPNIENITTLISSKVPGYSPQKANNFIVLLRDFFPSHTL